MIQTVNFSGSAGGGARGSSARDRSNQPPEAAEVVVMARGSMRASAHDRGNQPPEAAEVVVMARGSMRASA
ncbi:MAG: hypothetical protein ACOZQL_26925, partial [Myxococcota bacterium]